MFAILTRYAGPTNTRGSRIIATWDGGRLSRPYDHALSAPGNHAAAALAAFTKATDAPVGGLAGYTRTSGTIPGGAYAHVFAPGLALTSETFSIAKAIHHDAFVYPHRAGEGEIGVANAAAIADETDAPLADVKAIAAAIGVRVRS
jgi:hypothetical protein